MLAEEKQTCDNCGKKRICVPQDPNATASWRTEWFCKTECNKASVAERKAILDQVRAENAVKPRKSRFAYPCIGGPLDGQHATTADFGNAPHSWNGKNYVVSGPAGMYHHLSNDYFEFNSAGYSAKKIGGHPSMIYVHKSLIRPLISPKDR